MCSLSTFDKTDDNDKDREIAVEREIVNRHTNQTHYIHELKQQQATRR